MFRKGMGLVLVLAILMTLFVVPLGATAEGDQVTIELMNWNGGAEQKAHQEAIAEYMELNPNVTVELTTVTDGSYMAKLNTLVAADATPDIYYIAETSAIQWGLNGVAQDLVPLYAEDGIDMAEHFIPASLFGADGKVYGLAYGVVNIVMFYNKDLFDQYGVEYPSRDPENAITWEEYVEIAKTLTIDAAGVNANDPAFNADSTMTYGTKINAWFPLINALLYSNDARFFTEDGMDFAMDSPDGIEVLQSMADTYLVHKAAPSLALNDALPGTVQMVKDGQLAMALDGSYNYPTYIDEGVDVGVAALPQFAKPRTVSWASCNQISAKTENVEAVFDFFRWFCEAETNPRQIVSNFPNANAYYEDEELKAQWLSNESFNDDYKQVIPAYFLGELTQVPEPVTVQNAAVMLDEIIMPSLDSLWTGEATAEEVTATIRTKLEGQYAGIW